MAGLLDYRSSWSEPHVHRRASIWIARYEEDWVPRSSACWRQGKGTGVDFIATSCFADDLVDGSHEFSPVGTRIRFPIKVRLRENPLALRAVFDHPQDACRNPPHVVGQPGRLSNFDFASVARTTDDPNHCRCVDVLILRLFGHLCCRYVQELFSFVPRFLAQFVARIR